MSAGVDQRDVAGDRQHGRALGGQAPGRRGDRAGVAVSRAVAPHARAQAQGDVGGRGVDGDDRDARQFGDRGNGLQHVLEHREGQLLTHVCGQKPGEALFRAGGVLHRHHRPDVATRVHRAVTDLARDPGALTKTRIFTPTGCRCFPSSGARCGGLS